MKNRIFLIIALTVCCISLYACPAIAGNNVWTPMNKGMYGGTINTISIHPTNPNTVHAGTSGGGALTWQMRFLLCGFLQAFP
ncbi:MAG: hypothetical protein BWK80_42695 [Desulfobacteraceae bacterium IS3]|nr:MAG: hypothetical protein BWK80_42695 [Desulfobacteraceae bacterium IS3]